VVFATFGVTRMSACRRCTLVDPEDVEGLE